MVKHFTSAPYSQSEKESPVVGATCFICSPSLTSSDNDSHLLETITAAMELFRKHLITASPLPGCRSRSASPDRTIGGIPWNYFLNEISEEPLPFWGIELRRCDSSLMQNAGLRSWSWCAEWSRAEMGKEAWRHLRPGMQSTSRTWCPCPSHGWLTWAYKSPGQPLNSVYRSQNFWNA